MKHLRLSLIAAAIALASGTVSQAEDIADGVDAAAIHQAVLVLDSHADVLLASTPESYFLPEGGSRADLAHLRAGGVDAVVLAVAVTTGTPDEAGIAAARAIAEEKLRKIKAFARDNPDQVGLALSAGDVERLHREGKIAVLVGFQNAYSIGTDLSQIDYFYAQGVRVLGFNHAGHNAFSDFSRPGSGPPGLHGGLSELGREGVKRLNDLGVLIDVSQLSKDAVLQVLALTRAPVAATHSAARGLVDNTRNLSDEELDAIGANGGVVQVTPFWAYVHNQDAASLARANQIRAGYGLSAAAKDPFEGLTGLGAERQTQATADIRAVLARGTLPDFVDHIDYIARRIGWEHVGIGSDFDHGSGVEGFDSEADAPNVTAELVRRGYSDRQISGIWGGNFLRALRAAEAAKSSVAAAQPAGGGFALANAHISGDDPFDR